MPMPPRLAFPNYMYGAFHPDLFLKYLVFSMAMLREEKVQFFKGFEAVRSIILISTLTDMNDFKIFSAEHIARENVCGTALINNCELNVFLHGLLLFVITIRGSS